MADMNEENPYQSPRSPADPQPATPRFRWRILPSLFCGLYAAAFGYSAIDLVIRLVRMPLFRDPYFVSIIGVRLVIAAAWTLATRLWWKAYWWTAAFLTVSAILLTFFANKLKMLD